MQQLPDGYYAIPDPTTPRIMTYWRATNGVFTMWPAGAWHGPARLRKRDAPTGADERQRWLTAWFDNRRAWLDAIRTAAEADPGTALARFATLTTRCNLCGRPLTDDTSKVLGIGPDCRRGLNPAVLALVGTPAVATAHAEQLLATD